MVSGVFKRKHWRTPEVIFSIEVADHSWLSLSQKFTFVQTAYYVVLQISGDLNNRLILFAFQLFSIKRLIVPDDNVLMVCLIKDTSAPVRGVKHCQTGQELRGDGYVAHCGPHLCPCNFGNSGYQSVTTK